MKSILRALIFVCTILVYSFNVYADTITIKSDEWCPFNCKPGSAQPGYMIEIAKTIFRKAGHTVSYSINPWIRSIYLARKGKISAIVGATKGEVADFTFPEEEFGISMTYFFVKKGNPWRYKGVASLKNLKIGIQVDYEYGERLDEYFHKHINLNKIHELRVENPLEVNIKKLAMGRIDTVPENKAVFINKAKQMGLLKKFVEAGADPIKSKKDYESIKVYLAFSPKNPKSKEYAKIISEGIKSMRASGELQKILNKYGLSDWKTDLKVIEENLGL